MNCTECRRLILLRDSGELPARALGRVEAHLANCEPCRTSEHETRQLLAAARLAASASLPGNEVILKICKLAADPGGRAERSVSPANFFGLRWMAAAAAILLAFVGIWSLAPLHAGRPEQARLAELRTLVDMAFGDLSIEGEGIVGENERDQIARRLLTIEGFSIDIDEPAEDLDTILPPEHQPTDLQSHSIDGLSVSVCV